MNQVSIFRNGINFYYEWVIYIISKKNDNLTSYHLFSTIDNRISSQYIRGRTRIL